MPSNVETKSIPNPTLDRVRNDKPMISFNKKQETQEGHNPYFLCLLAHSNCQLYDDSAAATTQT
jgi:hypothetical protein